MVTLISRHGRLRLLGESPALDFANSTDTVRGERIDFLADYRDLVGWSVVAGLLSGPEASHLAEIEAARPERALEALAEALKLRRALRCELDILTGQRERSGSDDLPILLERHVTKVHFARRSGALVTLAADPLELPLVRLGLATSQLLTSPHITEVRICEGANCGWFFFDHGRASPRRWCSMEGCGNRAKVSRHRSRTSLATGTRSQHGH